MSLEQVLLPWTTCYVYKIPKLTNATSKGHRAELWDLANVAVEDTRLKVILDGDNYRNLKIPIRYKDENASSNKLFAECIMNMYLDRTRKLNYYVEDVADSSRYFVLRLIHPTDKLAPHVRIGMGFRERHEAIQFKECLYGYVASIQREIKAEAMAKDYYHDNNMSSSSICCENESQFSKLSLKEGETIHVKVHNTNTNRSSSRNHHRLQNNTNNNANLNGEIASLLRPPPSATDDSAVASFDPVTARNDKEKDRISLTLNDETNELQNIAKEIEKDDDEWGDFEEA